MKMLLSHSRVFLFLGYFTTTKGPASLSRLIADQ
jgi:hypothetical protein